MRWVEASESGPQVVALGLAVTLSLVVMDWTLVGRLSLFFDLSFVTLCLMLAIRVQPDGFFTVALLPPLLMVSVFVLVGAVAPELIAQPTDGVVQAVVSGLTHHSAALFCGYAVCLGTLEYRRRRLAAEDSAQPSNRLGSPAPTRITSG